MKFSKHTPRQAFSFSTEVDLQVENQLYKLVKIYQMCPTLIPLPESICGSIQSLDTSGADSIKLFTALSYITV